MRPINVAAWIATGLFTIWFFVRLAAAANIQTRYGSPASSPPYIFGLFLACAIVPGILWIISAATKKRDVPKTRANVSRPRPSKSQDPISSIMKKKNPEVKELEKKLSGLETEIQKTRETYGIVKESYSQKLIDEEKYQTQDRKLRSEFNALVEKKKTILDRIDAVENLQKEFQNLTTLKDKGIISEAEYESKREELILGYKK